MVLLWSWGYISAKHVFDVGVALKEDLEYYGKDNLDLSFIDVITGLGSEGAHEQNIQRDLMANLHEAVMLPRLGTLKLPLDFGSYVKECDLDILYPHELFAPLYHNYRDKFITELCGETGVVQRFWEQVRGHIAFT